MRRMPRNPLTQALKLDSRSGPSPTPQTVQLLRQHDLLALLDEDPEVLVARVQQFANLNPTAEHVYALAELAYIGAKRKEAQGHVSMACDLFGTAVANSYFYLFDEAFASGRNPYDPRFRRGCELYNASLESALRHMKQQGMLKPGSTHTVQTARQVFDFSVASRGTWHEAHFCDLKFVSDFDVTELKNQYRTYGLGVPMIANYQAAGRSTPADAFYAPGMSFPVTAFLRVVKTTEENSRRRHQCVIELHDTTETTSVAVNDRQIPLEVDLTTPLAYSLDHPTFKRANEPTQGLRNVRESTAVRGVYLLEPYVPRKIPVVMVHGFWSSLVTWMEMFNDLRGTAEIRDRFQFWFYLYPSGEPFWYTAAHLRGQLARARQQLDPNGTALALDQMLLVGHSAGGLIAELQTVESGDAFWRLVSPYPLEQLSTTPELKDRLEKTFFFHPDKSVRRVVTIATPHRGSIFSNETTQWLGDKLIQLPDQMQYFRTALQRENTDRLGTNSLLQVTTNVRALAPDTPFLTELQQAPHAPWVTYHNIIGKIGSHNVLSAVADDSDGIVTVASAKFPQATSELVVDAPHSQVHRHPRTVLEVRRILHEHLRELRMDHSFPGPPLLDLTHCPMPPQASPQNPTGATHHP